MCEILSNLYLGYEALLTDDSNIEFVKRTMVTHILTLNVRNCIPEFPGVKQKFVQVVDDLSEMLILHFDECCDFIEDGRTRGTVFIHCAFGTSRSPSAICAYMMRKMNICVDEAVDTITRRATHRINLSNFLPQLKLYHQEKCQIAKDTQLWRELRLRQFLIECSRNDCFAYLPSCDFSYPDPSTIDFETVRSQSRYKCKKCRRLLFMEQNVLKHKLGNGQSALRKSTQLNTPLAPFNIEPSTYSLSLEDCNNYDALLLFPMQWMSACLSSDGVTGQLKCPKCATKLGSIDWNGRYCRTENAATNKFCGAFIIPWINIITSSVDYCAAIV